MSHARAGFLEVGVVSAGHCTRLAERPAAFGSAICPVLVEEPNRTWCLQEARLCSTVRVRLSTAREGEHRCRGMILLYRDGTSEALGQVQFGGYLSQPFRPEELTYCNALCGGTWRVHIWARNAVARGSKIPSEGWIRWWTRVTADYMIVE